MPEPDWITVKETAYLCGVSRHFLYVHREDGEAPPHHKRAGRSIYSKREVQEWIDSQRVAAE